MLLLVFLCTKHTQTSGGTPTVEKIHRVLEKCTEYTLLQIHYHTHGPAVTMETEGG